jgi:peptide-methionine (R)-S-oxide reductase
MISYLLLLISFGSANAFATPAAASWETSLAVSPRQNNRREMMQKTLTFGAFLTASPANARSSKSRTTGYDVQHTESEWSQMLSPQQNFILRQGGTESPYSSILEGEDRAGLFICAGCGTPLFNSKEKFHSGTGWPR